MRAIVIREFGGPEVMTLDTVPDPVAGDGQVVVRVRAAGVNPVDTYIRSGAHTIRPQLPYTPGFDRAGGGEGVGRRVASFAPGRRVYRAAPAPGTYAGKDARGAADRPWLPDRGPFQPGATPGRPDAAGFRRVFRPPKAR